MIPTVELMNCRYWNIIRWTIITQPRAETKQTNWKRNNRSSWKYPITKLNNGINELNKERFNCKEVEPNIVMTGKFQSSIKKVKKAYNYTVEEEGSTTVTYDTNC